VGSTSRFGRNNENSIMEKLFIIKIGGNIIDDKNALHAFLKDLSCIATKKILVHGGGKLATQLGEQLGIASKYVNGRRITDAATMDLVTMVYGGLINKKLVAQLQALQCNAIGLTGADANCIPATKRAVKEMDYGFAGDVDANNLNANTWQLFLQNNYVPIVAPITHDGAGQLLNTNADTIASSIAMALSKQYHVRLIYCFEKKGVLQNVDDDHSVITHINKEKYAQLLKQSVLADGILPKLDNAFAAIDHGVQEIVIAHANELLQNLLQTTTGTLITA
jgi:acetylglutamate kinase